MIFLPGETVLPTQCFTPGSLPVLTVAGDAARCVVETLETKGWTALFTVDGEGEFSLSPWKGAIARVRVIVTQPVTAQILLG